jgi:ATP/maltotriose-dependent transcriptional regulator MalT
MIDNGGVRSWLMLLRRPDRLADTELVSLLRQQGVIGEATAGVAAGDAASEFLIAAIERMRPPTGAPRERQLPHLVLSTCFIDGAKLFQAANLLGMSQRQLSRERAWAIGLLTAELQSSLAAPPASGPAPGDSYPAERIPVIGGFLPRSRVSNALEKALSKHRLVVVAGPAGVGKTSLVAELAANVSERARVLWHRFRPGVSESLAALLYEMGELLATEGSPQLRDFVTASLPDLDLGVSSRLAIRGLGNMDRLLVFDDFHLVDSDASITGFLDDAVNRLPQLRIVVISRHQQTGLGGGAGFDIPVFSRLETSALLKQRGVEVSQPTLEALHEWTSGVPQLVNLAAAWLKTATPGEVASGLRSLGSRAQVQEFLLDTITELLAADDRAILDAASIFRTGFTDDSLAAVANQTRGAVLDASQRLLRAHVATRSRDGDCGFFHASVREYIYDRIPSSQRVVLHTRAAAWFTQAGQAEEAKYHRAQAKAAQRDLGQT